MVTKEQVREFGRQSRESGYLYAAAVAAHALGEPYHTMALSPAALARLDAMSRTEAADAVRRMIAASVR